MAELNSIPSHAPHIVATKTGNEYVLVPVKNNIADMNCLFTLNETGAFVWEHIDGKRSVGEIISAIMEEYDVSFSDASEDIQELLEQMKEYLIIDPE